MKNIIATETELIKQHKKENQSPTSNTPQSQMIHTSLALDNK